MQNPIQMTILKIRRILSDVWMSCVLYLNNVN